MPAGARVLVVRQLHPPTSTHAAEPGLRRHCPRVPRRRPRLPGRRWRPRLPRPACRSSRQRTGRRTPDHRTCGHDLLRSISMWSLKQGRPQLFNRHILSVAPSRRIRKCLMHMTHGRTAVLRALTAPQRSSLISREETEAAMNKGLTHVHPRIKVYQGSALSTRSARPSHQWPSGMRRSSLQRMWAP